MEKITTDKMQETLFNSWSIHSSTLWTTDNPAAGHCGVTALVVNDILGGDIVKTRYGNIWHFYNRINTEIFDFTKSQFNQPIEYKSQISDRDEAFSDTNKEQYQYLKSHTRALLRMSRN